MAGKVRMEKGDKFRLVEKRRKTGNKATGLKGLKASDGKAGVSSFFPAPTAPPSPHLQGMNPSLSFCPFRYGNHPPLLSTLRK